LRNGNNRIPKQVFCSLHFSEIGFVRQAALDSQQSTFLVAFILTFINCGLVCGSSPRPGTAKEVEREQKQIALLE
jgi:hypothetical protein